jgi:hypothetical protein
MLITLDWQQTKRELEGIDVFGKAFNSLPKAI